MKTRRELRGQMKEAKKRKQEELGADEETPGKIPATETDSEYGDFFSNTANSEISSRGDDPMDQHPTILPKQTEQNTHSIANTSTSTHTPNIRLQVNLHQPLTKSTDPYKSIQDHCFVFTVQFARKVGWGQKEFSGLTNC